MKRLTGILFLCFCLLSNVFAQQFNFSNYTIDYGLSQSVVNCLFQDSEGYIWAGTQNGLNRFDGNSFDVFRFNPSDPNSLSNNWIYAITEDLNGDLWIGTKGGLNKYYRSENRFERIFYETGFAQDVTQHIYDNIRLKNGNILVNTPPVISFYNSQSQEFSHFRSKNVYDPAVQDVKMPLVEDQNGNIWIGCTKGLGLFSVKTSKFTCLPFFDHLGDSLRDVNVTSLFLDKAGNLWVGTTAGLYRNNETFESFQEVEFELDSGEVFSFDNCIRSIVEDSRDNLILGTEGGGLFVVSRNENNTFLVQNYTSDNSLIGHNIVQCLLIDKSDNLWIGTLSGISKTDLKKNKFELYRNDNSPNSTDLLGNVIAGLFKNNDGVLWVGNWGQGLNLIDREAGTIEHFSSQQEGRNNIPNDFVHVIFKDRDGNIWIGTRDGIFIYDLDQKRFVNWTVYFKNEDLPAFRSTRIYKIIQDKRNRYWIGTSNGLYRIDLEKSKVDVFQQQLEGNRNISANLVYSILEDSDGLIWIATISGLDVYNPFVDKIKHHNKTEEGLTSDFVISLCEDSLKRIWIGTNAAINIFDKESLEFSYFSEKKGLPSNYIYEIIEDKNHDLWFATGNGLCRYVLNTGRLEVFTPEDGLQSPEFNLRAAFAGNDGELMFGGMNGFNTFYPDSLSGNPHIPNIVFTSFQTTINDVQEEINLEQLDKVVLDDKVQSFSIEFAALEFTNPEHNHYAYKMEGISDEWVKIKNRKFVPFFALPPGDYVFHVIGANNDGEWNKVGKKLKIVVLPPWWRSTYAYVSYFILISFVVFGFIKLRERRLKHDKVVLERKVEERTTQIQEQNRIIVAKNEELNELNRTKDKFFSIIGHDLRNHFNIIIGFSENLLGNFNEMEAKKQEQHISNIHKSSVRAHDLLGNLLTWARLQRNSINFHPERIDVVNKTRRLLRFHEEAALRKNILIEVLAREEISVEADVNMFSTIMRNLLANAIKFTDNDGEISVSLKRENGCVKIEVKDNGVGISKEDLGRIFKVDSNVSTRGTWGEKGTGLGLVLCKEFVEKHGGKIWVKSEVGIGSEFGFNLPLS